MGFSAIGRRISFNLYWLYSVITECCDHYELVKMWKEAAVACFNVLFQHSHGDTYSYFTKLMLFSSWAEIRSVHHLNTSLERTATLTPLIRKVMCCGSDSRYLIHDYSIFFVHTLLYALVITLLRTSFSQYPFP
jgi:hypothetical protein